VTGRNLPSTSQPKPEWPFFHREAEFRQFSGSTHGIRSANSPSFGYPLRFYVAASREAIMAIAIGSKFFHFVMLKKLG
jgi:hypothetical protein